jgi:hypothetical protein
MKENIIIGNALIEDAEEILTRELLNSVLLKFLFLKN